MKTKNQMENNSCSAATSCTLFSWKGKGKKEGGSENEDKKIAWSSFDFIRLRRIRHDN